ncbi:MAG TPA: D-alanyl-D-alanine carboxypeptidase/D-alanyl-D-alanine-endopeptidase [Streptosporangiaceae bacterium]|nr:D-alanyl-D-alanine carboxypeptidase/D-alanyl-D-alanine-endopeptidase [Streptosporangiaceae bacterium]
MPSRLRVTALACLAMLNVFTVGASVSVGSLLAARLKLWQIPYVATTPVQGSAPVLGAQPQAGAPPPRAGLARVLGPILGSRFLGPHVGAVVTDLSSGAVLFARQPSATFAPASSEKLVTAAAALSVLGPQARFTTRVVDGGTAGSIVLVGGGDPSLAAGRPPRTDYPQPATLVSLAAATADQLRARHEPSVHLGYADSLFTGPATAPGWTTSYITTGNVTPISALEVDQGRLTPAGAPQDADVASNFHPRSFTPSADAAGAFAAFLRADGIQVTGKPAPQTVPPGAPTFAAVRSPVVSALVAWMLRESNNVIAENLARQVALSTHHPASFAGGATAETASLSQLGVAGGVHLVDGSGLSPRDRISPATLVAVVRAAALGGQTLRPLLAGLPVAGFSGTLAPGGSVFGNFGPAALGMVRAKTGNLTRVVSLAGIAQDTSGRLLAFAFMADRLPANRLTQAAGVLDAAATALAECGCHG